MRDKNQTLIQFHEEVERFLERNSGPFSLRTSVAINPTVLSEDEYCIIYPRTFRELRDLSIIQWWFPDFLHWRVLLDLQERNFAEFTRKQRLELKILLSSKENALFFLWDTKKYTSCEIFGNLLKDGIFLKNSLRVHRKNYKIVHPQRKRGYDDKGSLRKQGTWIESQDFSFTLLWNQKEKERLHLQHLTQRILRKIRELRELEVNRM